MEFSTDFNYTHVLLREIIGMDSDVETLEQRVRHLAVARAFNKGEFRSDILKIAYARAPVLLIERSKGYECIGNPLNWDLAKMLYQDDENVPALVFNKKRMSRQEKLRIFAADLLIPHVLYRSRHGLGESQWTLLRAIQTCTAGPASPPTARQFARPS